MGKEGLVNIHVVPVQQGAPQQVAVQDRQGRLRPVQVRGGRNDSLVIIIDREARRAEECTELRDLRPREAEEWEAHRGRGEGEKASGEAGEREENELERTFTNFLLVLLLNAASYD